MQVRDHHPMLIRVHLDRVAQLDRFSRRGRGRDRGRPGRHPRRMGHRRDGETGPDAGTARTPRPSRRWNGSRRSPASAPALATAIIAETGLDMNRFPTAGHLVSWAGLAPVSRQSGPPRPQAGQRQRNSYLKGYCTQAATGAAPNGHLPRREAPPPVPAHRRQQGQVRRRTLHPRHRLAPARQTPKPGSPTWDPTGTDRKADRDRKIRAHLRQLQALGLRSPQPGRLNRNPC